MTTPTATDQSERVADRAELVDERLFRILGMVHDAQRFAEAKNATLVVVSTTAVGAIAYVTYLVWLNDVSTTLMVGLFAAELFFVLSVVVTFLGFLPRTNLPALLSGALDAPSPADNLYYFGHLAKYEPARLAAAVARHYVGVELYDPSQHRGHTDLAGQIVVNARITRVKLRLFTIAASVFAAGVVALVAAVLVSMIV